MVYGDDSDSLHKNAKTGADGPGEQAIDVLGLSDDLMLAVRASRLPWYITQRGWHNDHLTGYAHWNNRKIFILQLSIFALWTQNTVILGLRRQSETLIMAHM